MNTQLPTLSRAPRRAPGCWCTPGQLRGEAHQHASRERQDQARRRRCAAPSSPRTLRLPASWRRRPPDDDAETSKTNRSERGDFPGVPE